MDLEADQLVYGSFSFRAGGYDILARSAGCSPVVTAEVVAACRRFGQPPTREAARAGLFAVRLPIGSWAVIGVVPQGDDDRGRPGALAFHALIVSGRDYGRAGWNPFRFAPLLRDDWSSTTPSTLGKVRCPMEPIQPVSHSEPDPKVSRIVQALTARKRVAIEVPGPIDDLARAVWARLPNRVRRRASVATWAFSNEHRFDLAAFPRLAGVTLDGSYLIPSSLDAPPPPTPPLRRAPYREIRDPGSVMVAWIGLVLVTLATLGWSYSRGWFLTHARPLPVERLAGRPEPEPPRELGPIEARRVQTGLKALATRFEAGEIGPATDPTQLLARLNEVYHYRGRLLSPTELENLGRNLDTETIRVLAWHARVSRLLPDEAWPDDFARLSLARQLAAVARSFHLDPTVDSADIPGALIALLARPGVIQPSPMAAQYPALSEYARFLSRLPRADDPSGTGAGGETEQ